MQKIPVAHHPGKYLARALAERGRSQSLFAQMLQKTDTEVSQLISGKRNITLDRAMRIASAFGTSEEFWMKMQIAYDRYQRFQQEKNKQLLSLIKLRSEELILA